MVATSKQMILRRVKVKKDKYLSCSTRMEFIWPNYVNNNALSHLLTIKVDKQFEQLENIWSWIQEACGRKNTTRLSFVKKRDIKRRSDNSIPKNLFGTHSMICKDESTCFAICMTYLQHIFAGIMGTNLGIVGRSWP